MPTSTPVPTPAPTRAPTFTPAPAHPLPIIDLHFHADAGWHLPSLVQAMDDVGVTQAGGGALRGSDTLALDFARQYPGRFLPFAGQVTIGQIVTSEGEKAWTLESQTMRDYLAQLERDLQAGQWKGIGELFTHNTHTHPAWLQGTRYPADSPLMQRLMALSATYGVPVHSHMEAEEATVAELERLLAANRGGTFLWAHTGYFAEPPLLRRLFQTHPNLFAELSWRDRTSVGIRIHKDGQLRDDWKTLLEEFPDRFVLGSDANPSPGEYKNLILFWRHILSQVAADAAEKIAHRNAARLMSLAPATASGPSGGVLTSAAVAPTPTTTPTTPAIGDPRYAVVLHTHNATQQQWFLNVLGTEWFLDHSPDNSAIPEGRKKVLYFCCLPGPTPEEVRVLAEKSPGAVWYVVGEPNRRAGYGAAQIVEQLHDLYESIRAADPTARITSPSLLNWDFTCVGCAGYQSGHAWVDEFRDSWRQRYAGEEPSVDLWAIDVYPIDWSNLPTVDSQLAIDQVAGLRRYLDTIPADRDKPILVTELGLQWGWDGVDWNAPGCTTPTPSGTYHTDRVIGYLRSLFDWLELNADPMRIERWFLFSSYSDITRCHPDAYAGLTLFDGREPGAALTAVGRFFRDRVMGLGR